MPPEHLTADYQSRVYGKQIVKIALVQADDMLWKVTVSPARPNVQGGQIWLRFSPDSQVSAEFGR